MNTGKWWRTDVAKAAIGGALGTVALVGAAGAVVALDLGAERESVRACHDAVEHRLKSPGTADFATDTSHDGGTYTVRGHVDAQNGYGATVRASYVCEVARSDGRSVVLTVNMSG